MTARRPASQPTLAFNSQIEDERAGIVMLPYINLMPMLNRDNVEALEAAHRLGARLDGVHVRDIGLGSTSQESPTLLIKSIVLGARQCFEYLSKHANLNETTMFAVPVFYDNPTGRKELMRGTALDAAISRSRGGQENSYFEQLLLAGARSSESLSKKEVVGELRKLKRTMARETAKTAPAA